MSTGSILWDDVYRCSNSLSVVASYRWTPNPLGGLVWGLALDTKSTFTSL